VDVGSFLRELRAGAGGDDVFHVFADWVGFALCFLLEGFVRFVFTKGVFPFPLDVSMLCPVRFYFLTVGIGDMASIVECRKKVRVKGCLLLEWIFKQFLYLLYFQEVISINRFGCTLVQ